MHPSLRLSITKKVLEGSNRTKISIDTKNFLYENIKKLETNPYYIPLNETQLAYYATYLETSSKALLAKFKEHERTRTYICGIYSIRRHKPHSFKIKITYSDLKEVNVFPVEMADFHQDAEGFAFKGFAKKRGKYLYINLEGERGDRGNKYLDHFYIILYIDHAPANMGAMAGVFSGTSFFEYPICGEILMIAGNEKFDIAPEDHSYLMQYLMLSKKSTLADKEVISNIQKVTVGSIPPSRLNQLVGEYYVLNLDGQGRLIISQFSINEHYRAFFNTIYDKPENNQVCRLKLIAPFNNLKLHIETFQGSENDYSTEH